MADDNNKSLWSRLFGEDDLATRAPKEDGNKGGYYPDFWAKLKEAPASEIVKNDLLVRDAMPAAMGGTLGGKYYDPERVGQILDAMKQDSPARYNKYLSEYGQDFLLPWAAGEDTKILQNMLDRVKPDSKSEAILAAAKNENKETALANVKLLEANGANINVWSDANRREDVQNIVNTAAGADNVALLDYLKKKGMDFNAVPPDPEDAQYHKSPFVYASGKGATEAMAYLAAQKKPDAHEQDMAMLDAAVNDQAKSITWLVTGPLKVPVDGHQPEKWTPLYASITQRADTYQATKELIRLGANKDQEMSQQEFDIARGQQKESERDPNPRPQDRDSPAAFADRVHDTRFDVGLTHVFNTEPDPQYDKQRGKQPDKPEVPLPYDKYRDTEFVTAAGNGDIEAMASIAAQKKPGALEQDMAMLTASVNDQAKSIDWLVTGPLKVPVDGHHPEKWTPLYASITQEAETYQATKELIRLGANRDQVMSQQEFDVARGSSSYLDPHPRPQDRDSPAAFADRVHDTRDGGLTRAMNTESPPQYNSAPQSPVHRAAEAPVHPSPAHAAAHKAASAAKGAGVTGGEHADIPQGPATTGAQPVGNRGLGLSGD